MEMREYIEAIAESCRKLIISKPATKQEEYRKIIVQKKEAFFLMEKFTDNLMIPLGALAFCLFVGWVWGTKNAVEEIESEGRYPMVMRRTWSFIVRFLAPLVIAVILYFTLGRGEGLS